jgi:hypothetical protein
MTGKGCFDFAARATPGVECVENGHYFRSICLNGNDGSVELSLDQDNDALLARAVWRSAIIVPDR